jgi:thiol-disulfide isomerase/thioredoxin
MKTLFFMVLILMQNSLFANKSMIEKNQLNSPNSSIIENNEVKLLAFSELEKIIVSEKKRVLVINFWATWCGPCIKELPDILSFAKENKGVTRLILVSFDFPNEIQKVKDFVKKRKLDVEVILIKDTDQNAFINIVSKNWEGTIPATWLINNKNQKKQFIEKPVNTVELTSILQEITK